MKDYTPSPETQAAIARHNAQAMDVIIGTLTEPVLLDVEPMTPAERASVAALSHAIYMLDVKLISMNANSGGASAAILQRWLAEAAGRANTLHQIAASLLNGSVR